VKYFITGSSGFDSLTLDPQRPGPYRDRVSDLLGLQDVNKTDLSPSRSEAAAALLMHASPTDWSRPRRRRSTTSGSSATWARARCASSCATTPSGSGTRPREPSAAGGFFASWDPLPALDAWVESGRRRRASSPTDQNAANQGAHPPGVRVAVLAEVQRRWRIPTARRALLARAPPEAVRTTETTTEPRSYPPEYGPRASRLGPTGTSSALYLDP